MMCTLGRCEHDTNAINFSLFPQEQTVKPRSTSVTPAPVSIMALARTYSDTMNANVPQVCWARASARALH